MCKPPIRRLFFNKDVEYANTPTHPRLGFRPAHWPDRAGPAANPHPASPRTAAFGHKHRADHLHPGGRDPAMAAHALAGTGPADLGRGLPDGDLGARPGRSA